MLIARWYAQHPLHHLVRARRESDSLLRLHGFGGLVGAAVVSILGSSMALLAVAWVTYQYDDSIVHTVIVVTAYSLPAVVLGPLAGRLAETRDCRRVVINSYVGQMLVWDGIAFLAIIGWLTPWWLMLGTLLGGTFNALHFPAWKRFERGLVPDGRLDEANAVFASSGSLARIVGAVGGGFIITLVGPGVIFALNALSYLPLVIVTAREQRRPQPLRRAGRRVGGRETIAYVRTEPTVLTAIIMISILTLLAVPIGSLLPAVADQIDDEAHVLGLLTAFYAIGGSLVALVLRRVHEEYPKLHLIAPVVAACGGALIVIGLLGEHLGGLGRVVCIIGLLLPIGLGVSIARAVLSSVVQLGSSPEMEVYVLGLYGAAVSLVTPIGGLSLAAVTELTSVWLSVAVAGGLLLVVASPSAPCTRRRW